MPYGLNLHWIPSLAEAHPRGRAPKALSIYDKCMDVSRASLCENHRHHLSEPASPSAIRDRALVQSIVAPTVAGYIVAKAIEVFKSNIKRQQTLASRNVGLRRGHVKPPKLSPDHFVLAGQDLQLWPTSTESLFVWLESHASQMRHSTSLSPLSQAINIKQGSSLSQSGCMPRLGIVTCAFRQQRSAIRLSARVWLKASCLTVLYACVQAESYVVDMTLANSHSSMPSAFRSMCSIVWFVVLTQQVASFWQDIDRER